MLNLVSYLKALTFIFREVQRYTSTPLLFLTCFEIESPRFLSFVVSRRDFQVQEGFHVRYRGEEE
jgi:hypothetical protein